MSDYANELSFDEFDEMNDPRDEPTGFERALSRRRFLGGTAALGAAGAGGLGFEPVAANGLDTVAVPPGFSWRNVIAWGDPLWSDGAPFDRATRGAGASQERAFGDNNDGMSSFDAGGRTVLAVTRDDGGEIG